MTTFIVILGLIITFISCVSFFAFLFEGTTKITLISLVALLFGLCMWVPPAYRLGKANHAAWEARVKVCHDKGGVIVQTRYDTMCVNKSAIIQY